MLHTAPTVPTAVMAVAVNSTAITVTWGRPDTPNGIIRGYNISYLLPDSGDEVVINVEPIIRTVTVGDLSPFTSYEFTVAAFTIEMGPGETVNATTDEAGLRTHSMIINVATDKEHPIPMQTFRV